MWVRLKDCRARYEAFLRIDASLDAETRTRARVIYLTGIVFLIVQLLNMISMYVIYDGWDRQHTIALGVCTVFAIVTNLVRWTKSPWVFGTIYAVLPIAAVGASAVAGSSATAALGINTSLLPLLAAAMAFSAFIGTRWTGIAYALSATGLIVVLHRISAAGVTDEATRIILYQRALQGALAVLLVAGVAMVVAGMIYRNLRALEAAVERAQDAEAARAQLMNAMSHEIRTPLNGIIAMTDMVARAKVDADTKTSIDLIQRSADSLLTLLDTTLERARDEQFGVVAKSEPFDLAQLMQDCTELFRAAAQEKGLWIGTKGMEQVPSRLVGDPGRLQQVFSNLLGNAVKFTQKGGVRLGVNASTPEQGRMRILFYIQDTGHGIAAEDQDRIFAPYEQSDAAQTTSIKGTGLGLPICRELVEAMGGQLALRSAPGKGSVFHFTLELALAADATEAARAA